MNPSGSASLGRFLHSCGRDSLAGYSNLGRQLLSFRIWTWSMSLHFLITHNVLLEKQTKKTVLILKNILKCDLEFFSDFKILCLVLLKVQLARHCKDLSRS